MTLFAQNHTTVSAAPSIATPLVGYQQISASTLAAATSLTVPANASYALIQCEGTPGTDNVRWRDDGTAPTATVGMLMNGVGVGTTPEPMPPIMFASDLTALQFIKSAGAPILNVSYYRT